VDDRDLDALRSFRLAEAEPPAGLQERIEERLWQAILAEEASRAPRAARQGESWWQQLLRPAVAAGAPATIAVAVAVMGGNGSGVGSGSASNVSQAGVFDATAASLFGASAATGTSSTPISGAVNLRETDETDRTLARGPMETADGRLDDASLDAVNATTRDPEELQAQLLRTATSMVGPEQARRLTFAMTMRWVVNREVPGDLRAAMLRSLQGLPGMDDAIAGVDLLGRSGIVVGYLDPATGLRSQYLLDPDGGNLLEQRTITTAYLDPACPPGTFTSHELYDENGHPVAQQSAPWLDWPLVVEACDPFVTN
jgi:hypothetical protein